MAMKKSEFKDCDIYAARIANECNRVGLPVPEVKEEYGCVTTVFRRPDWTGGNTPDQRTGITDTRTGTAPARTGTGHGLSGIGWTITGMTGAAGIEAILARIPKLRKDARANVESVLHELIADKNATIPQICARTGMALRTINNALATLREAGILKARGNEDNADNHVVNHVVNRGGNVVKEKPVADSVVNALRGDPRLSAKRMASMLGMTSRTIQRTLKVLQETGRIRRLGGTRGKWEVL